MALYKQINSSMWWVSYTDANGKQVRRSTKTRDAKEAKAIAKLWEKEVLAAKLYGTEETRTFEDVMGEFLKWSKENKRSYEDDVCRTRKLKIHFKEMNMNHISGQNVKEYVDIRKDEGMSNRTVNRELALLSAAINYCNKRLDWNIPNKTKGHKLPEGEGIVRWLTKKEAERLVEAAKKSNAKYLADFIVIALNTGCRSGELLGLTWDRVDLNREVILLDKTKTGKRRTVPLNKPAKAAFINRFNWQQKFCPKAERVFCNRLGNGVNSIKKGFASACEKADIKNFRIHDMRHTCAAWLVMQGVPLIVVRDLLGHSSVTTTEIYAHLAIDNVKQALSVLDN